MALSLETQDIPRRTHVRTTGLINGGVYRPKGHRRVRRGRHRAPGLSAVLLAQLQEELRGLSGGDLFLESLLLVLIVGGAGFNLIGLVLYTAGHNQGGFATAMTGVGLFVIAAVIIGFVRLDPSPD